MEKKVFLISRTDSIGDVILTLPICAWIKNMFQNSYIIFLGNSYTKPIVECYPYVDEIMDWRELKGLDKKTQINILKQKNIDVCIHVFPKKEIAKLAKKLKIPTRIGTSHRVFHFFTCNLRPNFSRRKSDLHESQLNFELLRPLGLEKIPSLAEIQEYLSSFIIPKVHLDLDLSAKNKIILHTKSKGSAVEWPMNKFFELAVKLADLDYEVYFTGTEAEAVHFRDKLPKHQKILDMSAKFTLTEFIYFISQCEVIVAGSTGPLHIGAVSGIKTIGIYSQTRPIHQARWRPIGKNVSIVTNKQEPEIGKINPQYLKDIEVDEVFKLVIADK